MKKVTIYLLALFLVFAAKDFTKNLYAEDGLNFIRIEKDSYDDDYEEVKDGTVKVRANVSGAKVYVDGNYKGTAPVTVNNLKKGRHKLEVSKNHYETKEIYFSIGSRQEKSFYVELEKISGFINYSSDLKGVSVTVDGLSTVFFPYEVDEGFHNVTARKFGYKDSTQRIYVTRNSTYSVHFSLEKAPFEITKLETSKQRFNPQNKGGLGCIDIEFSVTAASDGVLTVSDSAGNVLASQDFIFSTWDYEWEWDGSDQEGYIVSDGLYTATLTAGGKSVQTSFYVDSTISYPMLNLTSWGTGIGSCAMPFSYPEGTLIFNASIGASMDLGKTSFYGAPWSAGMGYAFSDHFEVSGKGFGSIQCDGKSVYGLSCAFKISDSVDFESGSVFYYGASFKIGGSNGGTFEPFGYDSGNGLGAGLMFGLENNGKYFGLNSDIIYKSVTGVKADGNHFTWKNGFSFFKNFGTIGAGAHCTLSSFFGEYEYHRSIKGRDIIFSENTKDWTRCVDAGFEVSTYPGTSSTLLHFKGGILMYTKTQLYGYAEFGISFLVN